MKFTRAIPLVLSVIAFQTVSAAPLAPSAYHRRSGDLDARKLTGAEIGQAVGAAGAVITALGAVTTGIIGLFKGKNKRDFDAQDFTKNLEILKLLTARDTPSTDMMARDPVVTLLDLLTSGSDLSRRDDDDDDDSFNLGSILDMVEKAVGKVDEVKTGFKDVANEFKGAFKGDGAAKVLGTTTVSST
jgi:hypothetical protein